jgi:hypothetical protein
MLSKLSDQLLHGGAAAAESFESSYRAVAELAHSAGSPALEQAKNRLVDAAIAAAREAWPEGVPVLRQAADLLAGCPGSSSAWFVARHNLACLLRNQLELDTALSEWGDTVQAPLQLDDAMARYARTISEVELADLLARVAAPRADRTLLERAVTLLDGAIVRERTPELPGTKAQVRRALIDRVFDVIALTAWEHERLEFGGAREKLAGQSLSDRLGWIGGSAWDRVDAAVDEYAAVAGEWGDAEAVYEADRLRSMFGGENALATARSLLLPWAASADRRGNDVEDWEKVTAAATDEMHLQTLARLFRFYRCGQPFVLLLRSFGTTHVESSSALGIPMVGATYASPSVGAVLDGLVAAWLEQVAPVVSVAQQSGMVLDDTDRIFPRLTLWSNWLEEVRRLAQEAAGVVVAVGGLSEGLVAELQTIRALGLEDKTVLVCAPGIDRRALKAFPHRIVLRGGVSTLQDSDAIGRMRALVQAASELPAARRLGAGVSVGRPHAVASCFVPPGWLDQWEEPWSVDRKRWLARLAQ